MLHLTTDPTWDTPNDGGNVTQAVLLVGVAVALLAGIVAVILLVTKRREAAAIAGVVGAATLITGGAVALGVWGIAADNADFEHDRVVATWLNTSYGANVDESRFHLGRETILEATATIDGKPAIIKLARTADGHIAVFTSDDKPLPRRAH